MDTAEVEKLLQSVTGLVFKMTPAATSADLLTLLLDDKIELAAPDITSTFLR